jgi:hypothetical protein
MFVLLENIQLRISRYSLVWWNPPPPPHPETVSNWFIPVSGPLYRRGEEHGPGEGAPSQHERLPGEHEADQEDHRRGKPRYTTTTEQTGDMSFTGCLECIE